MGVQGGAIIPIRMERFKHPGGEDRIAGRQAAWPSGLGRGLQSPVRRFDSARRLQLKDEEPLVGLSGSRVG